MTKNVGTVVQIIGAVLDIRFEPEKLPNLLNAVEIEHDGSKLVVEVAQHIGDDVVRCIAMGDTSIFCFRVSFISLCGIVAYGL